ncbi:MAG: thiamine pyrophosphate-binding protein, partial [Nanoarchaeota archaeon]
LRKLGVQELDIIELVKPITKYAVMLEKAEDIAYELDKCIGIALEPKMGPCWIDIPTNLQTVDIKEDDLFYCIKFKNFTSLNDKNILRKKLDSLKKDLQEYKRPAILAGAGIRSSKNQTQFRKFVEKYNVPFVTTYFGVDLIEYDHNLNIGVGGIKGNRAGNFCLSNTDFVLCLGTCLNVPITGYNYQYFAPEAKIVIVDIDEDEHKKSTVRIDEFIKCDLTDFFSYLNL